MRFEKSANGDVISAIDNAGKVVGQIRKNRMGTHGHWHGWLHYPWCDEAGRCVWVCVDRAFAYGDTNAETRFTPWSTEPSFFSNIRQFQDHYLQKEEQE